MATNLTRANLKKSMSSEDSKIAFKEYAITKDRALRDRLFENFIYIAEILAKKYSNKGIEYDDIFQVACIGLLYAIERYDASKGFEFSSFATPTIIGEIKKYFRDKGWTIKVPRRIQELSKKINDCKNELSQTLQRSPTVSDISEVLGISEEDVFEVMEASRAYTPQSLDVVYEGVNDENDINLIDFIKDEDTQFLKVENADFLRRAMENLNDMEKQILVDRYFNHVTQVMTAQKLKVSQMTVSRVEKKMLEKLKKEFERF